MIITDREAELISFALEEYSNAHPEYNKLLLLSRLMLEESEITITIVEDV